VTCPLKARTVEPEEMAVAREQLGKQVSVTIDTHATMEEPLEAVFYAVRAEAIHPGPKLKGKIFNNMLTLDERPSIFITDKPIFSSQRMLHMEYDHKASVEKKNLWS
jgi:hypothetical protein